MTDEKAPVGNTKTAASEPGASTEQAEGKLRSPGGYDDDAFNKKARDTEEKVFQTFQKVFKDLQRPVADTDGNTGSDFAHGNGSTIEDQMRNATADIIGTLKGLSSALHQAGQKKHPGTNGEK